MLKHLTCVKALHPSTEPVQLYVVLIHAPVVLSSSGNHGYEDDRSCVHRSCLAILSAPALYIHSIQDHCQETRQLAGNPALTGS